MLVSLASLWEQDDDRSPKGPKSPKEKSPEGAAQDQRRQQNAAKKRSQEAGTAKAGSREAATKKRLATVQAKRKAATRAALATAKTKRQAARKARKEKPLPSGTRGGLKKSPADQVPAQIAHCVLALNKKGGKSVRAAWNICRWAMTKYGYLKGPYRVNTKLPKAVRQTSKGSRRSFQHGMEKGPLNRGIPGTGPTKYRKFKQVFRDIEDEVVPKGGR
jgi:hypothetical protein